MKKSLRKFVILFGIIVCLVTFDLPAPSIDVIANAESTVKNISVGKVTNPAPSVKAGTYSTAQKVKFSTSTQSATIYYTTDGTTPTKKSKKYTKAITVSKNTTIKAKAYKNGYTSSNVVTFKYKIKVNTPQSNVKAGTYYDEVSIKLSCKTSGAVIYYTTDGTTPTKNSHKYSGEIKLTESAALKARAYKDGYTAGNIKHLIFKIQSAPVSQDTENNTLNYVSKFGYDDFSDDLKKAYTAIYDGITSFDDTVNLTGYNVTDNDIPALVNRIDFDNPHLFQMTKGYTYTLSKGIVQSLNIKYKYTKEQYDTMLVKIENRADEILKMVEKETDIFQKIKIIHDTIILNASYGGGLGTSHNPYGVLVDGKGVCESYSRAFQYICKKAGIPVMLVRGYSGEAHMWNLVQLEGEWYHIDVTWDDPMGVSTSNISYNYFNITDDEIKKTHIIYPYSYTYIPMGGNLPPNKDVNHIPIPECTATKYSYMNYYGLTEYSDYQSAVQGVYEELAKALETKAEDITIYFNSVALRKTFVSDYLESKDILDDMADLNEKSSTNKFSLSYTRTSSSESVKITLKYV